MAEHHYLPSLKKGTPTSPLLQFRGPGYLSHGGRSRPLPVAWRLETALRVEVPTRYRTSGRDLSFSTPRFARSPSIRCTKHSKRNGAASSASSRSATHHNLPITLEPVPIEAGSPLANALQQLAPPSVELERGKLYRWLDTALLRVGEVTVGALSPLTLVYTGVRDLPLTLRLVESGRLRTPSDPGDLRIVAQWVAALRDRLQPLLMAGQGPHTQITDDLNTLL